MQKFYIIIMAVLFGLSYEASAQDMPPDVQVSFRIEASNFKENLPRLAVTEKNLTKFIAQKCADHFPFVQWRMAESVNLIEGKSNSALSFVLAEENAVPLPRIVLTIQGVIEGQKIKLPEIAPVIIYQSFDLDRPTHDPDKLSLKIQPIVRDLFISDVFQKDLYDGFLRSIPLASHIVVIKDEKRIIIPVRWETLRIGEESVLKVLFTAKASDGQKQEGLMKLTFLHKRWREPNPGSVMGAIHGFEFAPITIEGPGWHENIPAIFAGEVGSKVYMDTYIEKIILHTEGDLVTSPQ